MNLRYRNVSEVILRNVDAYLPIIKVKRNSNDLPWVTDNFRFLIKQRQYHFNYGNDSMYKFYRNKVNRERKFLKQQYVANTMNSLKGENPKHWWQCIKSLTGKYVIKRLIK